MAGIAVSSNDGAGRTMEAVFDSFTTDVVSSDNPGFVPMSLDGRSDVGSAQSQVGFAEYDEDASYVVSGSGGGIKGTNDGFHFVHFDATGDFVIEATVADVPVSPHANTKAGIMIRQSLQANSPNAFNHYSPSFGSWGKYRGEAGGMTELVPGKTNRALGPVSLRLTKIGSTITWERKIVGEPDWWLYSRIERAVWADGSVLVGMAISSGTTDARATALFEGWSFTQLTDPNQYVIRNGSPTTITPVTNIGGYRGKAPGVAFTDATNGFLHIASAGFARTLTEDGEQESDQVEFHELTIPSADFDVSMKVENFLYNGNQGKVGIMVRSSTDPLASQVFFFVSPRGGAGLLHRSSHGEVAVVTGDRFTGVDETVPVWMRLIKFQNSFTAYLKADDGSSDWEVFDKPVYVNMDSTLLGLAVNARDSVGWMANGIFSNINTVPFVEDTPYNFVPVTASSDIGNAALTPGFAEADGTTYRVRGAGSDIWDMSDGFHFAYFETSGDFEIEALVDSIDPNPDVWTKAGVMIRQTLDAESVNCFVFNVLRRGPIGQIRSVYGGTTVNMGNRNRRTEQASVRLKRVGGIVTYSRKLVGGEWEDFNEQNWPGDDAVFVGMAVTSHQTRDQATAIFKDWKLTAL